MKNIGVWIDKDKAVIIPDHREKMKTLDFGAALKLKDAENGQSRFGTQFISDEKTLQKREEKEIKIHLEKVINEIKGVDHVVLFGPANMKNELEKEIKKRSDLHCEIVDVVTADSMTENQLSEWVDKYYHPEE